MTVIVMVATESKIAGNKYKWLKSDQLIYHASLAYADLVVNDDLEAYLDAVTKYKPLNAYFNAGYENFEILFGDLLTLQIECATLHYKFNTLNRWGGDNGNDAFTESLRCWKSGKKQVVKWTAEGAVKCDYHKVFCDVAGRRHLPGIYWYPAKCTGHAVNQGGTADKCFVRPWQKVYFCQGRFFWGSFDGRYNVKGVFPFSKEVTIRCFQNDGGAHSMERTRRNTSENMWRKWKWLYWPISGSSDLFLEFQ